MTFSAGYQTDPGDDLAKDPIVPFSCGREGSAAGPVVMNCSALFKGLLPRD